MSLIVGRLLDSQIRIICDSKISDVSTINRGTFRGGLKLIILDRYLCLGYAGNVGRAQTSIENAFKIRLTGASLEDVIELLFSFNLKALDTDFIIGSLENGKELIKISEGRVDRGLTAAWVGDINAFNIYQEIFHKLPGSQNVVKSPFHSEEIQLIIKMGEAFEQLLKDGSNKTVDAPSIVAMSTKEGFIYAPQAKVFPVMQTIPSHTLTPIRFGNVAEGSYGYSVFTPESPGIGVVGIYFYPGNVGALFYPVKDSNVIIFRNVTQNQFREKVFEDHGILIEGIRFG